MPVEKVDYLLPYQFSLEHVLYHKLTAVLNAFYYRGETLFLKARIGLDYCYGEGEVLHFGVKQSGLFHQLYIAAPLHLILNRIITHMADQLSISFDEDNRIRVLDPEKFR